jgi:tyrosinase
MKALPASNACSWKAQAAIHAPGFGPAGPCDHGTMFWAWHRMYLYWFERIVRHHSGVPNWALPYWDYGWETTLSSATRRQIPAPLRDTTSTLYDGTRNAALNSGGSLSAGTTATAAGFIPTGYFTAQSSFQGTPHNVVHTAVNGDMGSFATAGLDPLFWLHHCEIDRLWNLWLAKGGSRKDPLTDASWTTTSFTFYNEHCDQVHMTACEVLQAAAQLGYVYQEEPRQVNETCPRTPLHPIPIERISQIPLPQLFQLDSSVRVLPLAAPEDTATRTRLTTLAQSDTDSVVMELNNVQADLDPGVVWEVYVGLPPNEAPDAQSPHFVGCVSLFGDGIRGQGHHPAARFTFPLNRALRAGNGASAFQVRLLPTSGIVVDGRPQPPAVRAPIRIGEANLLLDKAQQ